MSFDAAGQVVLVDAGGANLGSVCYALERIGVGVQVTAQPSDIAAAARVILPGVGAAAAGMARLHELGLVAVLRDLRQPLLGICLGMQLLYEGSEEGDVECLGLIRGRVERLPLGGAGAPELVPPSPQSAQSAQAEQARLYKGVVRVPHMGWNRLRRERDDPLLAGIRGGAQVYFVHSYAAPVDAATLASCDHGGRFAAVVRNGTRYGAQFHPERSADVGLRLLRNFIDAGLQ